MMKKLVLISLSLLLLDSCAKKNTEYSAYALRDRTYLSPGAWSFIALRIDIPDRHYIYGNPKGPGTGKATEVSLKPLKGFAFGNARFLPPKKHEEPAEKSYTWIYSGSTTVFVPVKADEKTIPGAYSLPITIDTLLCSESSCMPRIFHLAHPLEVTDTTPDTARLGDEIQKLYGSSLEPGKGGPMEVPGSSGKKSDAPLTGPAPGDEKGADKSPSSGELENTNLTPVFPGQSRIAGLLEAIIFGFIAGFILNFMPCVLPVVSLKIMGLVKHAGSERGGVAGLGALFSLGIMTSFLLLALLTVLFGYNWGDLFQYSGFLVFLTAVVFALALSMFEVYVINVPSFAGKAARNLDNPYADAYLKGLLATLLATPCSGPFLGGTLAWTLNQSPVIIFTVFAGIGAGMSLPYLVLTANPSLVRFVPKPGQWTRTFEHIMGFLLLFTVIYLLNIMDSRTAMPAITFLGFIAAGFWQYGRFGSISGTRRARILSALVLLAIICGGYLVSFKYLHDKAGTAEIQAPGFDPGRLLANRDQGKITLVKFTADWCPNCKFVEKISLNTEKVAAEIRARGIEVMTADMTISNPPARDLLTKLGSRSIPFLAVFPSGSAFTAPLCLRDIYSERDVLDAIETAVKKSGGKK